MEQRLGARGVGKAKLIGQQRCQPLRQEEVSDEGKPKREPEEDGHGRAPFGEEVLQRNALPDGLLNGELHIRSEAGVRLQLLRIGKNAAVPRPLQNEIAHRFREQQQQNRGYCQRAEAADIENRALAILRNDFGCQHAAARGTRRVAEIHQRDAEPAVLRFRIVGDQGNGHRHSAANAECRTKPQNRKLD